MPTLRMAILADMASQFITQAIKGYAIEYGVNFVVFEADYNQIDRQILDPNSELYEFAPDYVLILRGTERLTKQFYKADAKTTFADAQLGYTENLHQTILSSISHCRVITNTFIELNDAVFGNYAAKVPSSLPFQLKKLNLGLMELAQINKNLFLVDIDALVTHHGYRYTFDSKIYVAADMVFSIDFLPVLAKNICDVILSIHGKFKKCIILDLDNTTWGGIIGDDGMEGIQIGDLGTGKIFSELQLWIKQLKQRGIIVAVCSKNTEEIALEPFKNHPEMVLRLEDIAVFMANWENKADNIRAIQSVLNINMDAIVFIDDNPFERELVKKEIPGITVPDMPEDPAEYLLFLKKLNLFETASYTEGDAQRTQQYQEEAKRTIKMQKFANEDEFLASLNMKSVVASFNSFTIPRVSQLSQRSNQFNLRTVRYTEEELNAMVNSDSYFTYSFTLTDTFGDNGLISFAVLKKINDDILFIENWAMSCRVLKRGMEQFIINCIVADALQNGFSKIQGEYIPTAKNMMVKELYQSLHFISNENFWELDITTPYTGKKFYIKRV
ncbi:HAD-IIIC family phosphatase [Mucilaginibacter limnophilus]|uniref:HAD-IIIC family phosphatase n=2 Tax=Mucilaginibacter limnophilus TaxID=1932778 RepID=A0A3S2UNX3_9SPHI|nr:HAD-IIIC family phosphatase [Mucilaginibacter limnophilus]